MCEGDGFEELQDRGLSPGPLIVCFNKHSILLVCCCGCLVAESSPTLFDPMDYSLPGSSVMGFPRQEYWSGLPFPSLGDLPHSGIEPESPILAGGFFTTEPPRKPT